MTSQESTAVDSAVDIKKAREEIDALDLQILELIKRRRDVSHEIQRQRMSEGGTRTVLSRENVILALYAAELGAGGTTLALNILGLCRGRTPGSEAGDGARADS
ncbi:chorismate mutase [Streptomyces kunmingensis]|uniref:Chorismate mutase n=1 Tax=Streptomyces kunmingensis TaxID=68225 RepID=A0ABU6CNE5_9ACTN|nr:chorismate mutase [Streptomyces kunmingensis]MEB3966177.1 chorismate mutase [Streptomyces kunmingensis]